MELSHTIKRLRGIAKVKQAEVASAIGIKRPNYVNKENGKTPFSIEEMFAALSFFKDKVPADIYTEEVGVFLKHKLGPIADLLTAPKTAAKKTATNKITVLEEHQALVSKFKYKKKGLDANKSLLTIESMNEELFFFLVGRLEHISAKMEAGEAVNPETEKDSFSNGNEAVNQD